MDITVSSIKNPTPPSHFHIKIKTSDNIYTKNNGNINIDNYKWISLPLVCPPEVRPWGAQRETVQVHVLKFFLRILHFNKIEVIPENCKTNLFSYEGNKTNLIKLLCCFVNTNKNTGEVSVYIAGFSWTVLHQVYCHSIVLKVGGYNTERSRQPVTQIYRHMSDPVISSIVVICIISCINIFWFESMLKYLLFVQNSHEIYREMYPSLINFYLMKNFSHITYSNYFFYSRLKYLLFVQNSHVIYRGMYPSLINFYLRKSFSHNTYETWFSIRLSLLKNEEMYLKIERCILNNLYLLRFDKENTRTFPLNQYYRLICDFRHSNLNPTSYRPVLVSHPPEGGHGEVFAGIKMVSGIFSILKWREG